MDRGKEKCEILKAIRMKIAEKYGLDYTPSECNNDGECIGTCPKCEAELTDLQKQLEAKGITDITADKDFEMLADQFGTSDDQEESDDVEKVLMGMPMPPDDIDELEGDVMCPPENIYSEEREVLLECPVAGIGFHDIENVWEELDVGDKVSLIREKDNPHDKNAVAVALYEEDPDDGESDTIIGYIPRKDNKAIAALIDMGWSNLLEAEISKKIEHGSNYDKLHITVYVKSHDEVEGKESRIRLMVFSDKGAWKEFTDDLWKKGYTYFRWGGFPTWELDLPEKGNKVVFLYKEEEESSLYLMKTIATDEQCLPFLKNKEELYYVDDCSPYVLTNIFGRVRVKNEDLAFLGDIDNNYGQPDMRLTRDVSEKLLEFFK